MITRRSVWSDPKVQELLRSFVPAADEVWRLQHTEGAECDLFRLIAEQGHYAGRTTPSDTRQGIYATTPSGILLASANTRDARGIARLLESALARWQEIPEEDRYQDETTINASPLELRWERQLPRDGLVLRVNSRDLPRDPGDDDQYRGRRRRSWKRLAWNQDYAWFRAQEMRRFLPNAPRVGAETTLPAELAHRIARLHVIDNVRGQVSAFAAADIEEATIRTRITKVSDERIVLSVEGATRAVRHGRPDSRPPGEPADQADPERRFRDPESRERGVRTTMLGTAEWDRVNDRFVRFDVVALGSRWGATRHNGRERDLDESGIGFTFTLADKEPPVAPAYIWEYGWR